MVARKTTEEFVEEAKNTWGDRFDYSPTEYVNGKTKVSIACPIHGAFYQRPDHHLGGRIGCSQCAAKDPSRKTRVKPSSTRVTDTESFIAKATQVWEDRWDYSSVEYVSTHSPVVIGCRKHGEFEQSPFTHLAGSVGCASCRGVSVDTESFVRRATEVWGDRWDYSKTQYTSSEDVGVFICPIHGEFSQRFGQHLRGSVGCGKCSGMVVTTEEFVSRARDVWGGRFDYSVSVYRGATEDILVTCREHGEFTTTPHTHLHGNCSCKPCGSRFMDASSFKEKARALWGDRFDYSNVDYVHSKDKVEIMCKKHGAFYQRPNSHLTMYNGCPKCTYSHTSVPEQEMVEFIRSLDQYVVPNVRGVLGDTGMELDAFSESKGIAVEFNGLYWHSDKFLPKNYHYDKWRLSNDAGIRLVQVWSDDWAFRRPVVEAHLRAVFGKYDGTRLNARDGVVSCVSRDVAKQFLDANHIQGYVSATHHYGLVFDGEVCALASFKKSNRGYDLVRYATSALVRGGHSKIVKHFERVHTYSELVTFADLMFSDGGLYRSTGWVEAGFVDPDYQYVVDGERRHKFSYRKSRFKSDPSLEYEEGLTEYELASLNGMYRVYDAGKLKFVKPHPDTL